MASSRTHSRRKLTPCLPENTVPLRYVDARVVSSKLNLSVNIALSYQGPGQGRFQEPKLKKQSPYHLHIPLGRLLRYSVIKLQKTVTYSSTPKQYCE